MISYDDIRDLHKHPPVAGGMVLSMYVNVDQSNAANLNRGFETVVENEIRQMSESQNSNNHGKNRFNAECHRVLDFLKGYTPKGRGLVIFSDSTNDFWWQRELQVGVPTGVRWSSRPWVRPLLDVIEQHDPFAVVLIDKQQARILTVDAGGMQQHAEIVSDVPNKHATTGTDHIWSQGQMDRDHTNHIKLHAKRVADELAGMIERLKVTRVVIGGPVEATSMFANELPKRIQQMIVGSISAPVDASHARLLNEIRDVQERAEHEDEVKLVESMITSAKKGDRAVLGISDTLAAIEQGRVHCMVIARDFHTEGKQCTSCRILVVDAGAECAFCGGQLELAPDLINRASYKVLDQAGKVQPVSGPAADRLAGTGIGAVLRF
jgi:peptide subunit release factor 1 (eRF1)